MQIKLTRMWRTKLVRIIDKDKVAILHIDDHIRASIIIEIFKSERDRSQVLSIPDQDWSHIDTGVRGITARKLNDFNVPIKINGDKMAGMCSRVVMPDDLIRLIGTRSPIAQIILRHLPPTRERDERFRSEPARALDRDRGARTRSVTFPRVPSISRIFWMTSPRPIPAGQRPVLQRTLRTPG